MKVHRYSEHQRRIWVHEMIHKTKTIKAICTEAEISRATLYNWLSEFSAAEKETENKDEKQTSSLHWQPNDKYKMLLSALVKMDTDKSVSRRLARELVKRYNLTTTQACALVNMPEEAYGYRPRKPEAEDKEVYAALIHLLEEQSNRSLEDCIALLQQSQPQWAIKQIKRIYRQGRLYLKRTRIRRVAHLPEKISVATIDAVTQSRLVREGSFWHLGLIEQELFWMLFLLDYTDGTPLNILVGDGQISEADVTQFIIKCADENGLPRKIRIPAVAPFPSRDLTKWSWEKRVTIYNLSLAKPENILELEYIQDDIKKQLEIDENTTPENLQIIAEKWLSGFAENNGAATNYFAKETVVG